MTQSSLTFNFGARVSGRQFLDKLHEIYSSFQLRRSFVGCGGIAAFGFQNLPYSAHFGSVLSDSSIAVRKYHGLKNHGH